MSEECKKEEYVRARNNLYNKKRGEFGNKDHLAKWFVSQLEKQHFSCYYCETSIFLIIELISNGLLKTRKTGYGERGPF